MYTKILVPLDGSSRAEQMLPHVRELAKHCQSKILLFKVLEAPSKVPDANVVHPVPDEEEARALQQRAEAYLADVADRLRQDSLAVQSRLGSGPVVEAILNAAVQEGADLVAFASHGRSGLSRVFYGSVAAGLLQRIDRPILLIRST
ncbi:MAG: universal stress protein [Desulfohalobiaceae bacterium]|nr:universal stress protein [Desulfohalobiaceae bacterium]